MIKKILNSLLIVIFLPNILLAKSDYFKEGINLYNDKKFEDAKFKFEQDIVFNPKSELSYLYLSKIFNKQDKRDLEEQNLNTVMLLNPKNDEAIYMLTLIKIEQSNYNKAKELIDKLVLVCESFCSKKKEIQEKMEKLTPENAKNNN